MVKVASCFGGAWPCRIPVNSDISGWRSRRGVHTGKALSRWSKQPLGGCYWIRVGGSDVCAETLAAGSSQQRPRRQVPPTSIVRCPINPRRPAPSHMASAAEFVSLAKSLPPRLTRFFARYPPGTHDHVRVNPFKPTVHLVTHKWHNPVYSLRRQAELCKLARQYGVEELLPPSRKSSAAKEEIHQKRLEKGLGVALEKVKGHKWERTLKSRCVFLARSACSTNTIQTRKT